MWCIRYAELSLGLLLLLLLPSCGEQASSSAYLLQDRAVAATQDRKPVPPLSELERSLISQGLVDVQKLEPGIRVSLAYAGDQNFLHKTMYQGLNKCYLPCEVAIKLCNAEYFLSQARPGCHLIVFDAVRPLHIQQQMWDELDMPAYQKINYLANPADISLHNYGAAVDVGIITEGQQLLDMGTAFDSFQLLSQPKYEARFLAEDSLTQDAYNNRVLLRKAMLRAGFSMMQTEWWHFNSTNKATAAARYRLID